MISRDRRRLLRRLSRRLVLPLVLCLAATLGFTACTPAASHQIRIEVYGDSLAYQAIPYLNYFFGNSGRVNTKNQIFPATAICDWTKTIGREVDPRNTAGYHPNAIVMIFSGVALYPCMTDAHGVALSGQALIDKYESDARIAIMYAYAAHIPIYFASTPILKADADKYVGDTPLGEMFKSLSGQFPGGLVRFIDAAQAVEWLGHYTDTMPCAAFEHCTGRWPDGTRTVVVRAADGIHFCPVPEIFFDCPTAMPGAMRFAAAITKPVLTDFRIN
jgi:hypothetical protein